MPTLTLLSWNVNGLRAVEKKGFLDWMHQIKPDVLCLQETKAHAEQLSQAVLHPDGYESYWNAAERKGYSGTAIYTRTSPIMAMTQFGHLALDGEGRIVLLEFETFFLFNVYFPNGKSRPDRLEYKLRFYDEFLKLMESFRKQKPIVLCGDVNTAHTEIDLAHPKANEKTSGFLPIERQWIDKLIAHGYVDTLRQFTTEGDQYTWWDVMTRARSRNVGWRIDYFFISKELAPQLEHAWILKDVMGSDHCPVGIKLRV